jgi:hypothetical protein
MELRKVNEEEIKQLNKKIKQLNSELLKSKKALNKNTQDTDALD